MLVMGDSTTASAVPNGLDAYLGYTTGDWRTYPELVQMHPTAKHLSACTTRDPADWAVNDMLDIEAEDALATDAPGFVVARPDTLRVLYTFRDNVASVMWALRNVPRRKYKVLASHFGQGQHICGPSSCGLEWQADGCQWVDWGQWDQSLLPDNFFTVPSQIPEDFVFVASTSQFTDKKGHVIPKGMVCLVDNAGATNLGDDWTQIQADYAALGVPIIKHESNTLLARFTEIALH